MKTSYVYIMASKPYGTLYTGVTSDITGRVYEHKYEPRGFVKQYKVQRLVYYDMFWDIRQAIYFEKSLKRWHRQWKIQLIMKENPH